MKKVNIGQRAHTFMACVLLLLCITMSASAQSFEDVEAELGESGLGGGVILFVLAIAFIILGIAMALGGLITFFGATIIPRPFKTVVRIVSVIGFVGGVLLAIAGVIFYMLASSV